MLAIKLPKDIENRLGYLAKLTGRTKKFYAKKAILASIEDMEDTFIALHRIENSEGVISMEEVERSVDEANRRKGDKDVRIKIIKRNGK